MSDSPMLTWLGMAAESPAEQQARFIREAPAMMNVGLGALLGPYRESLPPTPSKPEVTQAEREAQIRGDLKLAYHERWAEAVERKWKYLPGAFESTWFDYVLNDLECQYWQILSST